MKKRFDFGGIVPYCIGMTETKKFFLYISILAAGILLLIWGCSNSRGEAYAAPTPSAKVAEIAQVSGTGGIKIQSVTIDGVEYLVATTYRGVAMCRK